MLPAVFQALKASSDVKNIVGQNPPRIYRHGSAPQDTARPYITWQLIFGAPENNLSDPTPVDRATVQINCWHRTDAGIEALAAAARAAVEPFATITGIPVDTFEPETKLYHMALQVDWFVASR